jgi:hypothetical protein
LQQKKSGLSPTHPSAPRLTHGYLHGQTRLLFQNTPLVWRFQTVYTPSAVAKEAKGIYHLLRMARAVQIITALLCMACVVALCIAPWVDPPETTLKSLQVILFLMFAFVACALLVPGLLPREMLLAIWVRPAQRLASHLKFLRQTNCVQQC